MENGPGAGPWHRARGKDDLALLLLEFASSLGETFHQDGQCVYADDHVAISLIHETGTAPSGDRFDNLAVYISRLRPDGQTERLWTAAPTLTPTQSQATARRPAPGNPHPVASTQRLPAREAAPELAVLYRSAAANSTKAHSAESAIARAGCATASELDHRV